MPIHVCPPLIEIYCSYWTKVFNASPVYCFVHFVIIVIFFFWIEKKIIKLRLKFSKNKTLCTRTVKVKNNKEMNSYTCRWAVWLAIHAAGLCDSLEDVLKLKKIAWFMVRFSVEVCITMHPSRCLHGWADVTFSYVQLSKCTHIQYVSTVNFNWVDQWLPLYKNESFLCQINNFLNNGDWWTYLKGPEYSKSNTAVSLVIKPLVFPDFNYPEEQVAWQSQAPDTHKTGDQYLSPKISL